MQGLHVVVDVVIAGLRNTLENSTQFGHEPPHEGDASLDLRDLNIFVGLMRLADRAGTADDRRHIGQLELACF